MLILLSSIFGTDCDLVQSFAVGLGMNTVQPARMSLLKSNCCFGGTGVTCSNGNVTKISWVNMGLNGSINATAVPASLSYLNLNTNFITGGLPDLPTSLFELFVYQNNLNGTVPDLVRYKIMDWIDISTNGFSGPCPTLYRQRYLIAGNNRLEGPLMSNGAQWLFLENNLLTGTLDPLINNIRMTLQLNGNLLTGPYPAGMNIIRRLYLGSSLYNTNRISGVITFTQPWELSIVNNLITSLFISDVSLLTHCDISYNPVVYNETLLKSKCKRDYVGSNYTQLTSNYSSTATYEQQNNYYESLSIDSAIDITSLPLDVIELTLIQSKFFSTTNRIQVLKTRNPIFKTTAPISSTGINLIGSSTYSDYVQELTFLYSTTNNVETININTSYTIKVSFTNIFGYLKLIIDVLGLFRVLQILFKRYKKKHSNRSKENRLPSAI